MNKELVKISKFLSLVLRHKPEIIGLSLDQGGWAQVDELLLKANRAAVPLTRELLRRVVEQNDKQRFTFSENGSRIRASYGHSITVNLGLEPLTPPQFLFHGTALRFLESIKRQGLGAKRRTFVHLSSDKYQAINVGKRHGKPIVLTIQAACMHKHGFNFYRATNGVWLTEKVPGEYILFPKVTRLPNHK